jgi:hypothetical protein
MMGTLSSEQMGPTALHEYWRKRTQLGQMNCDTSPRVQIDDAPGSPLT